MQEAVNKLIARIFPSDKEVSGPGLSIGTINGYNAARGRSHSRHICHAPFTNMYFNVHGDCAPCWLTFLDPDHYPDKSVREIWFGNKFQDIRNHLMKYDLSHRCSVCLKNLQSGNYTSLLARAYDGNEIGKYPAMLELELSNTCNLECVMCVGELSSSIRKNRERLPPLPSPYDDNFADQLEEFIPHLKELRFNGGEPFLIDLVYKIFEKVERLNPGLKIVIATNGTVLNNRVKTWLQKMNIHINFSLDSLTPGIYETIRVNAKFSRVMEHFRFYHNYIRQNNRILCIMVNPMRNNWHEMPEFIRFSNKHDVNIWFNTIHRPIEWAIWSLQHDELEKVYATLRSAVFSKEESNNSLAKYNIGIFNNLVNVQIKNWVDEALNRMKMNQSVTVELSESEARDLFQKKITDFIYAKFNEGEEQKRNRLQALFKKTDQIFDAIKEKKPDVEFYKIVAQVPADVFYNHMENHSVKSAIEEFQKRPVRYPITS